MVDIDPAEIKKLKMKIDVPVQADADDFSGNFRQLNLVTKKDQFGMADDL